MAVRSEARQVQLSYEEAWYAIQIGCRRQLASMAAGNKQAHGAKDERTWDFHITGSLGECAFCKSYGLFWPATVNTYKLPDVGPFQIRTRTNLDWDLIVRPDDADDEPFVLVTSSAFTFRIAGWMYGGEAKANRAWFKDRGGRSEPVWWVPQNALHPMPEAV